MPKSQLDHPPFAIYPKPTRLIGSMLFLIFLAVVSIPIALHNLASPGGFAALRLRDQIGTIVLFIAPPCCLFGLYVLAKTLRNPKPILEVGEAGWTSRGTAWEVHLPWRDIERVQVSDIGVGKFIGAVPRDPEAFLASLDPKAAKLARHNLQMFGTAGPISESFLPMPAEKLLPRLMPFVATQIANAQPSPVGVHDASH